MKLSIFVLGLLASTSAFATVVDRGTFDCHGETRVLSGKYMKVINGPNAGVYLANRAVNGIDGDDSSWLTSYFNPNEESYGAWKDGAVSGATICRRLQ